MQTSQTHTHSIFRLVGNSYLRLITALTLSLVLAGIAWWWGVRTTQAASLTQFFQGFEVDNSGWNLSGGTNDATRVASGTNGITSKTGGFHGTATGSGAGGTELDSAFTRWGGYNGVPGCSGSACVGTFPANGYTTSVDIYLNLAATSTNDTRFDFTSAVNQPSGPHRRDFAFNAGFYNDTDVTGSGPRFVVSASNNTNRSGAFPKNPGRSPFTIAATGWYTFLHTFRNNGSGILAVDLSILNMSGTVLNTWTLSDPTDTIGVNVGGNRYGWFANNEFSFLAIDNSTRANLAPDPTVVYVDDNWIGLAPGTDPDGAGPATSIGYDAFATVQGGVDGVAASGQVIVYAGTYVEDVTINKSITVTGAGVATTTISGAIGGLGSTVAIAANNVEFKGFKITRQGNSAATWNDPLNSAGISIQGQAITGANIHDNLITQNRTGIDINNSNGHTVRNNVITDNRTGMIFRNQTDNLTVVENEITNNWTVGVLFLDGSGGTNSPVQTALNSVFFNNNISANWYGQIVDRQSGGALPAPGTNIKNFSGNWLGTASPFISTANSAEPGYAAQVPFTVPGGTAMPPGGQPDVLGPASANFDITPYLTTGTDTNVETTPGRGTYGFQGDFSGVMANTIKVNSTGATSSTPTAADNDYTRVNSAVQAAMSGDTIILNGTFNWAETNAALSWSKGSNGLTGDLDDYSILVPANRNNVTFTATSLGAATIQGPGDLPTVNLEGVFFFDSLNGGKNQGWTISNIRFVDFDLAIGMFFDSAGAVDAFKDTKILNNYIKIANDLNATVAPADVNQNIGIHFAFGKNQTISGNTIDFDGDGVSDSANNNFSSQVGMQSNTSGGDVYDGLQITNNILRVLNAQSANPQTIRGIWENSHGHLGNVTVSGNSFTNLAAGNNPATNLQVGFRVTSHSSPTTTVKYQNNTVSGANTGFEWIAGSDFAGNQPVQLISNTITGNNKGVLIQSNGTALLKFNRILGNLVSGVENATANAINAENNWWGCNFGPGVGGANCTGTPNGVTNTGGGSIDSNPWLVLGLTAAPNPIAAGGMSNLTASLKKNSDGVDTSLMGMGTFPDGVTAGFTGTLGTVAPPSAPTSGGMAMSVYTNTANGTATITTTVDQQTVILSLLAACPTITISPAAIPDAFKGTAYSQTFTAAGAISAVTWSVSAGTLPAGLTLSPAGVLSGTPTATGNFTFTVSATDANNCPGTHAYTLPVHVETADIADPAICTGPGGAVDVTATVTNGAGSSQPATFTASLPAGLLAVPGTCSANVGICNVVNGSTVSWSGNLAGNQTVTIKYKAQIGDQVTTGTQLCITSSGTVGASPAGSVVACLTVNCPALGTGVIPDAKSPASDQKAGSVLFYNIYSSDAANYNAQNTRISITNTHPVLRATVHLFFVDGVSCTAADQYLCLTPNQTYTFLASDIDPGTTGYLVAVAVDDRGCPIDFNYLIGDEYIKLNSGHAANLGAEAISALAGGLPLCDANSTTATLNFDGVSYNGVPRVLAVDNIPAKGDGNETLLILNRFGGDLSAGGSSLGTIFGLLYDDVEQGYSFNIIGGCQLRNILSNSFPRTAPRFESAIPAGRTGWMKLYSLSDIGMFGAVINLNKNSNVQSGAFNQGHNLHKLTLTQAATLIIPVFPPKC